MRPGVIPSLSHLYAVGLLMPSLRRSCVNGALDPSRSNTSFNRSSTADVSFHGIAVFPFQRTLYHILYTMCPV